MRRSVRWYGVRLVAAYVFGTALTTLAGLTLLGIASPDTIVTDTFVNLTNPRTHDPLFFAGLAVAAVVVFAPQIRAVAGGVDR